MRKLRTAVSCGALGLGLVLAVPTLAAAASISGTVSDESTHVGIAGVEVCPTPQPYTFEVDCTESDSSGHYSFTGLQPTQYMLSFSAWRNNLPYVSEFYDNKPNNLGADLVTLSSLEDSRQIDVELAPGGSIGGTLTDEDSGEPVANMAACARDDTDTYERCTTSDGAGHYQINGLPSGEYSVEYESWNLANYLREFYEDKETWAEATRVSVVAPETTSGIDAELAEGAEILGHVSEASSGVPVEGVMVCAPLQPSGDVNTNCNWTDSSGDYAIRGLPAGTYVVAFDLEFLPFSSIHVAQWWQEASTRAEATPLELTTPQTVTGIDGKVSRPYWPPPPPEGESSSPPPPSGSLLLPAPKPLPKCKNGFHRKLVKGRKRCVRKHLHRHPRHHRA